MVRFGQQRVSALQAGEGKLQVLSERNGLPCNSIHMRFCRDAHQALWLYSHCGPGQDRKDRTGSMVGQPQSQHPYPHLRCLQRSSTRAGHFQPGRARSTDGRLWFSNDSVVQMVDPDQLDLNPFPPPVHIEQVVAQDTVYAGRNQLRLPSHTRDIQIDYTALSFVSPQRVLFRVMLEGHDTQWMDVGTRRSAFYTNLSPGPYRFLVRACNNDGVWNDQGAELAFVIDARLEPDNLVPFAFPLVCNLPLLACSVSHSAAPIRRHRQDAIQRAASGTNTHRTRPA